jgi:hypothetical protein
MIIKTEFVEEIPRELERGTVYVSMTFGVVAHSCFCGCGHEAVTPLSPIEWELQYDGETISLYPSINNWTADCRSHYWIRKGRVIWETQWTDQEIEKGRSLQAKRKAEHYLGPPSFVKERETSPPRRGFWKSIREWFA